MVKMGLLTLTMGPLISLVLFLLLIKSSAAATDKMFSNNTETALIENLAGQQEDPGRLKAGPGSETSLDKMLYQGHPQPFDSAERTDAGGKAPKQSENSGSTSQEGQKPKINPAAEDKSLTIQNLDQNARPQSDANQNPEVLDVLNDTTRAAIEEKMRSEDNLLDSSGTENSASAANAKNLPKKPAAAVDVAQKMQNGGEEEEENSNKEEQEGELAANVVVSDQAEEREAAISDILAPESPKVTARRMSASIRDVRNIMLTSALGVVGVALLILALAATLGKRRRQKYEKCGGASDDCELRSNFRLITDEERLGIRSSSNFFL